MSVVDNIHVVHIASGDLWAGAEVQLTTLACNQKRLGLCQTSVILLNHGRLQQELERCGVDVTVLDEKELGSLAILRRMITALRELKPNIVHTHRQKENVLGSIAARLVGLLSVRSVHGAPEHPASWYHPRNLQYLLDRICGRWLQKVVIAVSADLADKLKADYPERHLRIIENGVDTLITDDITIADEPDGEIDIGIVGRLVPVKRVDMFISAANRLVHSDPSNSYRFHIYGDGPLQTELADQTNSLGLDKQLQFHGHSDHIHQAIASLDMLLICSDHEGLPMTLLEAMLLGTPVVAHAVGGIPAVLDQGRCGWLVETHDVDAYTEAMKQCTQSDEDRRHRADLAMQRVRSQYSAEANARALQQLYSDLLD